MPHEQAHRRRQTREPPVPRRSAQARPLLGLQRTAGNRAVTSLLQRSPVFDAKGSLVKLRFTLGTEIDGSFAQTAKGLVAHGRVDDPALMALQASAVSARETFSDDEQQFAAALLDPANAATLRRSAFAASGDVVEFPAASVTAARRAHVADLNRPKMPGAVVKEQKAAAKALVKGDYLDLANHALAMEAAAEAEYNNQFQGTGSQGEAQAALDFAKASGLLVTNLLTATLKAASNSTEGDQAMAGATYAVAFAIGSPLAPDLLSGRIKVDEIPGGSLGGGEEAAYQAAGHGLKGDTLYLPKLDVRNVAHRGLIVHELSHAQDDKLAAGPKLGHGDLDRGESSAYRAQAVYLLAEITKRSWRTRFVAISQAASKWTELVAFAMAIEARSDRARLEPVFRAIQTAAPATTRLRQPMANWVLTADAAKLPTIETTFLAMIRTDYKILTPQQNDVIRDGLGGQSLLDWVNRPL